MSKMLKLFVVLCCICRLSYSQNLKINGNSILSNDSIYSVGKTINDKKEGPWVYYKNDNIFRISYFKNDRLEKMTLFFFANGGLKRSIPFENGAITGDVKFYSKEGDLIAIYKYENDGYLGTTMQRVSPDLPPKGHDYNPLDDF